MQPGHEARVAQFRRAYGDIMRLAELRAERGVTQTELADELDVSQANISRLERENDLHLSTLAGYINGLAGELRIDAVFPEGTYTLMDVKPSTAKDPGFGSVTAEHVLPGSGKVSAATAHGDQS